jgi:hypothetical protein
MRSMFAIIGLALLTALGAADPAAAWTRPGHMVTAAIAYDEILRARPDLIPAIAALLDAHPDRGPFQVAVDRSTGPQRARRMFLECARWPDDTRLTLYDHPTWHAALWPVLAADATPQTRSRVAARGDTPSGEALQAIALNLGVLANPRASAPERAVSLCWVLHVVGDIHQPLHTAELFSAAYPNGDGGGSLEYLQDPLGPDPIVLHWLWDDSIHRSGVAADVDRRAQEIEAAHPRASLPALRTALGPDRFAAWARGESYPIAVAFAFGAQIPTSPTPAGAPPVPDAYWQEVRRVAESRVASAGYRIADEVIAALDMSGRP